eukprot:7177397-Pyramimonas_sp.AAC.1
MAAWKGRRMNIYYGTEAETGDSATARARLLGWSWPARGARGHPCAPDGRVEGVGGDGRACGAARARLAPSPPPV